MSAMKQPELPLLLALLAPLAAGCGSDAVSYSAPVGITFPAIKSADVAAGAVATSPKNITTESGNPYGKFTNAAMAALGRAPSRIAVTGAALQLLPSTNVAALQDVFTGLVKVSFIMGGSATKYTVATVNSPLGVGPLPMAVSFDSGTLPVADFADLASGSFAAQLEGPAATGFGTANASADLQATFTFVAYP
jgi:hypothetical protein